MQFDQGVFPIECNVLYPQVIGPPLAVFARDGIPIWAATECSIESGCQRLVKTGLSFSFPADTYGKLSSTPDVSRNEPFTAPGLITNELGALNVLCCNLAREKIKIKAGQFISYLHSFGSETVGCITSIGGLEELGLPSDGPNVHIVLNANELSQFNEQEKKAVNNFF